MPPELTAPQASGAEKDRQITLFHECIDLRKEGLDEAALDVALEIDCATLRRLAINLLCKPLSFTYRIVHEEGPSR